MEHQTLLSEGTVKFPLGIILPYAGLTTIDDLRELQRIGWFLCDGSEVSRKLPLFLVVGSIYGRGDGVKTFNLPDYRGRFLRGADDPLRGPNNDKPQNPAKRDPDSDSRENTNGGFGGALVGSVQPDALKKHKHTFKGTRGWPQSGSDTKCIKSDSGTISVSEEGDSTESRPKNIYVNWIVFAGLAEESTDQDVKSRIL